jgi:hypothetical protein
MVLGNECVVCVITGDWLKDRSSLTKVQAGALDISEVEGGYCKFLGILQNESIACQERDVEYFRCCACQWEKYRGSGAK